jgi:hypothetical protein
MALLTQRFNRLSHGKDAAPRRCITAGWTSRQRWDRLGHAMIVLGIMACTALWSGWAAPADVTVAQEYQVKAIFLYNFVQFVTWPAAAFPDARTPITIGILGDDPFGPFLEDAVRGEVVDGRALTIKRFKGLEEVISSHMLFVSKSETGRLSQILAAVQDHSILTVGETEAFAHQGGVINFITVGNKVRYEINVAAAKRANLDISSKLLKLAKIIDSRIGN